MRDTEAIAELIVATVHAALAPVVDRVMAAEARLGMIAEVRDRLVVLETKAAMANPLGPLVADFRDRFAAVQRHIDQVEVTAQTPVKHVANLQVRVASLEDRPVVAPVVPIPIDLTPIVERIVATESQLEPLADVLARVIVLETKAATVPGVDVVELLTAVDGRVGSVQERHAAIEERLNALDGVRDKVIVLETKQAEPPVKAVIEPGFPDPGPRLDAELARMREAVDWIRDKVIVLETKAAGPVVAVADPAPRFEAIDAELARLKNLESHVLPLREAIEGVRDKVIALETTAAARVGKSRNIHERLTALETRGVQMREPDPQVIPVDLTPVLDRVTAIETQVASVLPMPDRLTTVAHALDLVSASVARLEQAHPWHDRVSAVETRTAAIETTLGVPNPALERVATIEREISKDLGALRERVAVVEVRAAVPGPPGLQGVPGTDGRNGVDGRDGTNGTNGRDGIAIEDLAVVQQEDRAFSICAKSGGVLTHLGTATFPIQIYRGVWSEGRAYERGDSVTWAGSEWHCNDATVTKPGEGSKAWTLKVKRGRDGKDGKDAPPPLPVLSTTGRRS